MAKHRVLRPSQVTAVSTAGRLPAPLAWAPGVVGDIAAIQALHPAALGSAACPFPALFCLTGDSSPRLSQRGQHPRERLGRERKGEARVLLISLL